MSSRTVSTRRATATAETAIVHRDFTDGPRSRHRRQIDRQGRPGRSSLCRPVLPHRARFRDPRDGVPAHDQRTPERARRLRRRVSIGPSQYVAHLQIFVSTCRARHFPAVVEKAPTSPSAAGTGFAGGPGHSPAALVDGADVLTVDDLVAQVGRTGPSGCSSVTGLTGSPADLSILAACPDVGSSSIYAAPAAQVDDLIRPGSPHQFGIPAAAVDQGLPRAVDVEEARGILHEPVAARPVYARLMGEQN